MKNLFIFILLIFVGCVGLQVGGLRLDLPEIEGQTVKSLKEFLGVSAAEVESWDLQESFPDNPNPGRLHGAEYLGLSKTHYYESRIYQDPSDQNKRIGLLSIIVDGKPVRIERVAVFIKKFHPFLGPMWVTEHLFDRYKNTDKFYEFDSEPFLEQHPEKAKPAKADPERFKRHDACSPGTKVDHGPSMWRI